MSRDANRPSPSPTHGGSEPTAPDPATPEVGDHVLQALAGLEGQFANLRKAHEQTARRQAEALEREAKLAERQRRLEEAEAAIAAREEKLRSEQSRCAEQRVAAESAVAALEARQQELRAARAEIETNAATLDAERKALRAEQADLQRRAKESQGAAGKEVQALNQEWQSRLEAVEGRVREAESEKEAALAELRRRDVEISALREELDAARNSVAELESCAAENRRDSAATSAGGLEAAVTERLKRRRQRLEVYKGLLQTQARKIVAAQSALQKRHAECEQVLAARSRLATLSAELSRKERRIINSKARAGALATMASLAVTVGVLAVLSWEVTKRVVPGTYVAQAVIEADPRGRRAAEAELAVWQQFHEDLITDPRLLETAAERMKKRGIVSLGNAAELRDMLKRSMYMQSARSGSITLELQGEGADRTAMILDTYVTALKSVSDATRGQRSDDLPTVIAHAAAAADQPLQDDRVRWAASMLAGSTLAVSLMGLLVWSRLSRAKQKFDQDHAIESALAEIDWPRNEPGRRG